MREGMPPNICEWSVQAHLRSLTAFRNSPARIGGLYRRLLHEPLPPGDERLRHRAVRMSATRSFPLMSPSEAVGPERERTHPSLVGRTLFGADDASQELLLPFDHQWQEDRRIPNRLPSLVVAT
jgi:hypothetical protein